MSKLPEQKENCLNCGATLHGPYCSVCGQRSLEKKHASFWQTMGHFLGDFIHFDSLFFRTAIPLLLKPGFLVNEFLSGKHVKYFHPVKMYIFLSFLFFFLSFSIHKEKKVSNVNIQGISPAQLRDSILQDKYDSVTARHYQLSFDTAKEYNSLSTYDSVQQSLPVASRDGFVKRTFVRKALVTKAQVQQEGGEHFVNEMIETFTHNFPKLAFLLLPVFALLLKLFFRKNKMYYMEHLVFSIYFYNFFFLLGSISILLALVLPMFSGWIDLFYFTGITAYFYVALRKVYGNSRLKTFFKAAFFIFFFGIITGLAFLLNIFIAFLMI